MLSHLVCSLYPIAVELATISGPVHGDCECCAHHMGPPADSWHANVAVSDFVCQLGTSVHVSELALTGVLITHAAGLSPAKFQSITDKEQTCATISVSRTPAPMQAAANGTNSQPLVREVGVYKVRPNKVTQYVPTRVTVELNSSLCKGLGNVRYNLQICICRILQSMYSLIHCPNHTQHFLKVWITAY